MSNNQANKKIASPLSKKAKTPRASEGSQRSSGTADLVPAVLKDRSIHDSVEHKKKLEDKQLLLEIDLYTEDRYSSFSVKSSASARKGYVVNDKGRLRLCIDDLVHEKPGERYPPDDVLANIRLGGATVVKSAGLGEMYFNRAKCLDNRVVKKVIFCNRFTPLAVLLDIEMIPGIMEVLGPEVLHPSNVRDFKSCSWNLKEFIDGSKIQMEDGCKIQVDSTGKIVGIDPEGNKRLILDSSTSEESDN